ncbi:MAG: DUF4358 domain-containing protein [Eubacterium sp.]|nr:DUF4358 domain-containing protein [Eubacterium sp.]
MKKMVKKRFLAGLLACLMVISCLSACGKQEESQEVTQEALQAIMDKMLAAETELPDMRSASSAEENAAQLFSAVSDIDYEKVDKFCLSYSAEGYADEILLVHMKDQAGVDELKSSLSKHIEKRKNTFASYKEEEVPRVEKAQIAFQGNYVCLVICNHYNEMKTVFMNETKEG